MTGINRQTLVKATDRQMSADLAGETVLLNYEDGTYYSLNAVGGRIWELIQEARPVQEVLDALLEEYDTDPATCAADLIELLDEMAGLGLVRICGDGPAE